ncbi:AraC family transcriptional regulator [Marinomonas foliarum]|jgi:AraC-like DNA-binding protein|uniref:AraC family transcriptional regulator n=1 Tax=Marinomonas foliarum TaxID=491950 RepID=A0ABX7ILH9_9GAMM|nr:AraC family transcriptional regulator [Marinomonas foliarum]
MLVFLYLFAVRLKFHFYEAPVQNTYQRDIPQPSDTLGETLYSLRLNGLVYACSELSAPWGIEMPPMQGKMMFHIVTQGSCLLISPNHAEVLLKPGDLVLLPKGEGHQICSDTEIHCQPFFDIPVSKVSDRFEFMNYGGGGEQTLLTCGVLSFDHIIGKKLVSQLPPLIHMRSDNGQLPSSLQALAQLMADEATNLAAGGETVVAHLADIIVIKAIRHWIEHSPDGSKGWLGALKDPKIGKALAAMHAHPESSWTIDRLAEQAGMSRSGFSARFTEVVGTSAKQYLTEWRMSLARMKVMQSPVPLMDLAEELGYQSEAAFSRAYKRVFGVSPLRPARAEATEQVPR